MGEAEASGEATGVSVGEGSDVAPFLNPVTITTFVVAELEVVVVTL